MAAKRALNLENVEDASEDELKVKTEGAFEFETEFEIAALSTSSHLISPAKSLSPTKTMAVFSPSAREIKNKVTF